MAERKNRKRKTGKRGQNEGSIYQRSSDGRWVGVVSLGYQNGKLNRKNYYAETHEAVAKKVTEALSNLHRGLPIVGDKVTVGEFLDRWLEDSVKPSVRPKTYDSYEQLVRLYLKPDLGHIRLSRLSPYQVQLFLNRRGTSGGIEGNPLSPRTIQYVRAVLRRALGMALKWGLVARNVAQLVDPPHVPQYQAVTFETKEAMKFVEECEGERSEALYCVGLAMGLRQGEAFGLRWTDVDLQSQQIHLRVALHRDKQHAEPYLADVKTAKSRRVLPLPDELVGILRAHRVRQLEEKLGGRKELAELE